MGSSCIFCDISVKHHPERIKNITALRGHSADASRQSLPPRACDRDDDAHRPESVLAPTYEEASRLPKVDAILHRPGYRRVLEHVRCRVMLSRRLA